MSGVVPEVAVALDRKPPSLLVAVMNPVLRVLLRTPVGRAIRPFGLLEFSGRRSGRRYRIPVGIHEVDDAQVVVTPAAWRASFRGGTPVDVWHRGVRRTLTGTLDDDRERVAAMLRSLAARRGSLAPIGVVIPPGHEITAADVAAVDRAVIILGVDELR
jgi:hypothetical protein